MQLLFSLPEGISNGLCGQSVMLAGDLQAKAQTAIKCSGVTNSLPLSEANKKGEIVPRLRIAPRMEKRGGVGT